MRILSLGLLFALVGCGVENDSRTSGEETVTPDALQKLVGTYSMSADIKGEATYPAPVGKVSTVSSVYRLAKISLVDGKLKIREENCAGEIKSESSFQLKVDKKIQQTANPIEAELSVANVSGKLTITRPLSTQVLGANLADIENDKLPTDSKDKRLVKYPGQNALGAVSLASFTTPKVLFIPGVTITSDVYFSYRSKNTYSATLDNKGNLSGALSDTTEQSIVGLSNVLFSSAKGLNTVVTPKEKGSVSLTRIEDASTCETVIKKLAPNQAG